MHASSRFGVKFSLQIHAVSLLLPWLSLLLRTFIPSGVLTLPRRYTRMSYLSTPMHPPEALSLPSDTIVGVPAIAALNLASSLLDALEKKRKADHRAKEEADGEDAAHDLFEDWSDVSYTQQSIDPATWAANRAKEGRGARPEEINATIKDRLSVFLQLSTVPKARYVIEDAIALHKATRRAEDEEQQKNEDALLEFISHLSRTQRGFFRLQ